MLYCVPLGVMVGIPFHVMMLNQLGSQRFAPIRLAQMRLDAHDDCYGSGEHRRS
jgi:hypothetical protein